ncbi:uncharacterized protein JCM6883_002892 [Sporobolomyces salmoneus]|uniref:uncharacterized protein n=1 Tax=Sporobolomyces salmoneus TaxID=183962 RepID=UPI0031769DCE
MDGIPADPFKQNVLTTQQAELYLSRINLTPPTLSEPPSLELLSKLLLAQLENIPKDTSTLHVPESQWNSADSTDIKLSEALGKMPEGVDAFERIVVDRKGAFCFAINATFSAFLRAFGFRVSELVGRTFKSLGNDPLTHEDGWKWGTLTHQMMLADWEGSDGRYLVDGAWGPWAAPVPIKLSHGETVRGLNDYEAFRLVEEYLPLSSSQTRPIDELKGWTFSRRITPPGLPIALPITPSSPGYWSPQFHFQVISVPLLDFRLYHHFSATSEEIASFTKFWLVTKLLPNTGGARRSMMYAEKEGEGKTAKVYTTGGHDAKGSLEGRDVEWVEMKTGTVKAYLKKEFGFGFD